MNSDIEPAPTSMLIARALFNRLKNKVHIGLHLPSLFQCPVHACILSLWLLNPCSWHISKGTGRTVSAPAALIWFTHAQAEERREDEGVTSVDIPSQLCSNAHPPIAKKRWPQPPHLTWPVSILNWHRRMLYKSSFYQRQYNLMMK